MTDKPSLTGELISFTQSNPLDPDVLYAVGLIRRLADLFVAHGVNGQVTATQCAEFVDGLEQLASAIRVMQGTLQLREALPPGTR
ncbi:hypothetical protein [Actinophytocola xanthii]|uniref:hypothetical protein n=1 Tax=Actinophytocola xanthii TaxID=1912961 RepID=UPI001300FC41|nr:hypothetical protein [Actinophytocola xanthii]